MMRTAKSSKADLEGKRFIFREIGIILVLALILLAFEMKSYDKQEIDLISRVADKTQEEMVEITLQEKTPPPPSPMQQTTVIEIVKNEMEIEQEIEIDVEADQTTVVEEYIPIAPMEEEEAAEEEQVFVVVESMPSFPGGDEARLAYLNENLKYPLMARESGIQGRVFLTFVVEKDGSITDARILRGIGGGCDEEALRVVKNMPKWIPGKQRNVPVRVQFNLPISFILH
jgi:protein TonB